MDEDENCDWWVWVILLLAVLLWLCQGCAPYQSHFKVAGNSFTLPKDARFDWLHISIPTSNGPISLTISNGSFKMNPAVMDAKTAHDVALINAGANLAGSLAGAAAK